MRLVIFGLTVSSSWGNGHATLWRGLLRALAEMGHQVAFYEKNEPWYAAHRDLKALPGGSLRIYPTWDEALPAARLDVEDCDVAIVTSRCPDGVRATELVLASRAPRKVFYDLDTPDTLERLRAGRPVGYLGAGGLSGFDLVLSCTGGAALGELQRRLGARAVAPLYGGVDPGTHRPVPSHEVFESDLSYLGTFVADRQAALDALFLEPARCLPELRFLLGGSQYPQDFPWAKNLSYMPHVAPPDQPSFFCSSRLTLSVTRRAVATTGHCPSGRLFEAGACGTPVVSDAWAGLEELFEPGREILVARSTGDVIAALQLGPEALERIGKAARERVLGEHTARHRAGELLRLVEAGAGAWTGRAAGAEAGASAAADARGG